MQETIPQQEPTPVTVVSEDQTVYLPGSAEKKRAMLMYLLIGIIGSLGTSQTRSVYETYHLKQAIGRWTVCVACLVVSCVLLFIPLLNYIPLFIYLILIVMFGLCIKQVKEGKYARDQKSALSAFAGLGEWISNLFEIKM